MSFNAREIVQWVTAHLGRCPKCMRSAFIAAALAVCFAVMVTLLIPTVWATWLIWLGASALVALWVLHLIVYALRSANQRNIARDWVKTVNASVSIRSLPAEGRRQFLLAAIKAFGFAFLATTISFGKSRADTPCQLTSCDDPDCRCVEPTPKCAFCPNRNEYACAPSNVTICCSNNAFWSCQSPTPNCYGNGDSLPRCY